MLYIKLRVQLITVLSSCSTFSDAKLNRNRVPSWEWKDSRRGTGMKSNMEFSIQYMQGGMEIKNNVKKTILTENDIQVIV